MAERTAFDAIKADLEASPETDEDVSEDYAVQVDAGTHQESDPIAAKGLVASTRELARAVSEQAIDEIRSGDRIKSEIDEIDKVYDGEVAKLKFYAGGWAVVMLRRQNLPLRRLATRFPGPLGWLHRVLDYIGAGHEPMGQ